MQRLAQDIGVRVAETEWLVTGKVDSAFFADTFTCKDPNVNVGTREECAAGVRRLLNESCSRAKVISSEVYTGAPDTDTDTDTDTNTNHDTWRCSGCA